MTPNTRTQSLFEDLAQQEPADWVRGMIAYHQQTGAYRPEDLRRLLGDPTQSVTISPDCGVIGMFAKREQPESVVEADGE